MNLSDYLFSLDRDLERNSGSDEDAALGRRMALRKTLTQWGDQRHQEGYGDGVRDVHDAQRAAAEAEQADDDSAGCARCTLTEAGRFQVEEARSVLAAWDKETGDVEVHGRQRTLADQVRNLLAVVDQVVPTEQPEGNTCPGGC